jgi:hypothetical protein
MPTRRFHLSMGLVAVAVVVVGFGPGFASAHRNAPVTPLIGLHGAVFSAWLLLYLVQASLVATHRVSVHRRLGLAGLALAPAMIITGYATSIAMARRGFDVSGDLAVEGDPLGALVFPLGDLVSFAVLVAAALWFRRRPDIHKRLMLLATVGALMAAPLAHMLGRLPALRDTPPVILIPLAMLYLSGAIYDKLTSGRFHPVSLWGGVVLLVWAQARAAVVGPSDAWHAFTAWLVR